MSARESKPAAPRPLGPPSIRWPGATPRMWQHSAEIVACPTGAFNLNAKFPALEARVFERAKFRPAPPYALAALTSRTFRSCSLSTLKLPRVLVSCEKSEQLGETSVVGVAQAGVSVFTDPLRILPSQGFTNLHSKLRVGMDFPQHCWHALQNWLGSGGCFGVDFCRSVRERSLVPVLGTGLDDVRGARRPSRIETQASCALFEPANAPSFEAQVVAQSATIRVRFTSEAFAYMASEKDSEIHDFWPLIFDFKRW